MGDRICIMNQGRVVQIGRPLDVYREPADTFVASFLGNPPMNLLPGRVEQSGGRVAVRLAGDSVALPMRTASALGRHVGDNVIVGVRPEDIYESSPPGDPLRFARLPARVAAVEPLGAETLLMVTLEGSEAELIARIGRDTALRRGDRVDLALDTATVHLFDPATTMAIA